MLYDALFGPSRLVANVTLLQEATFSRMTLLEWRSPVKSVSLHLTRAFIGKNARFSGLS